MFDLKKFKLELERILRISAWHPTEEQLLRIKSCIEFRVEIDRPLNRTELEIIVSDSVHDASYPMFDGVDNSDLKSLLALALKSATGK
ncbi:conserved protein of unknown function [Pseudomonas sp. JV551A1]|uniref:Uncharacterized protein n=1 Tax=Pseudomonas inefficax TaxID=2078786 RepID=A0AAQ1SSZ1_9PSED|nr:conserved protein of unknown function [Pseudomonas sp. JV551A1]SPO60400.1 conserved protein of unknown function [Pseudomonas inefficax]